MVKDEHKRPRSARATLPNKGLEMAYRRKLLQGIDAMQASLRWWLGAVYKAREAEIVQDSSPSRDLEREIRRLTRRWTRYFAQMADQLATMMVRRGNAATTRSMQSALRDAGMTVRMQNTRAINTVLQSLVIENTGHIKTIAEKHMQEVQGLVMRSVQKGRDMGALSQELEQHYALTKGRAITISRDQTNKITEGISRARNMALGVTHGIWMHRSGSKVPRQSHKAADGKIFELAKGLLVDGEYIFPAQKINCHCTYRPILPGLPGEVMRT